MKANLMPSWMPMATPLTAAVLLLLSMAVTAQAEDGITVTGSATVKGKPSVVEISGTISGEGELANDASVKFHDTKKKATAAIENLKNPDLTMETEGSDIHEAMDPAQQQRIMQGMGNGETPKVRVNISETVKLRLKNVDKLETPKLFEQVLKLIDTSRDAGIVIGSAPPMNYYQMQMQMQNGGGNNLVQFKIPDITDLENQAYKLAIADARTKAQRIADLSGVKLGKVLSVHDNGVTSGQQTQNPYYNNGNNQQNSNEKEASSGTLGEIPVAVNLQVQFAIEKNSDK
jgi:uncharacterized protein YggE